MRIGFDGKRAVGNNTGLGNYSRLVIEELSRRLPDSELRVYAPRIVENPRLSPLQQAANVSFIENPTRLPGALWRTWGLPRTLRLDGVDIFHGLSNELPLNIHKAGIPSVVTIHDIIYRRLPHCYKAADRLLYDLKYGRSCRHADRIIAISECTKRDIIHYYGISEDKIDVVYQGCEPSFHRRWSDAEKVELRRRLSLPERYIVQVGTVEERKNLMLTIESLPALPEEVKLVVAGRHTPYQEQCLKRAEELGVSPRIDIRNHISFADLPGLYQCAEAAVYPSRYEGFGLPVIEAIAGGTSVVAATGSCLEEAGGNGALYVSPDDIRGMAEALRALLSGETDRSQLIARGRAHIARFDTSLMADNILAVYTKVLTK